MVPSGWAAGDAGGASVKVSCSAEVLLKSSESACGRAATPGGRAGVPTVKEDTAGPAVKSERAAGAETLRVGEAGASKDGAGEPSRMAWACAGAGGERANQAGGSSKKQIVRFTNGAGGHSSARLRVEPAALRSGEQRRAERGAHGRRRRADEGGLRKLVGGGLGHHSDVAIARRGISSTPLHERPESNTIQ